MAENSSLNPPLGVLPLSLKAQNLAGPKQEKHIMTEHEAPYVSHRVRIIREILDNASPSDVETSLSTTGISPSPELIEEVLKLSYNNPDGAVSFFRWAGLHLKPTSFAWNLMVDLLGQNKMFEQMWDAIRSMKQEGVLSVPTFVFVFGSYCAVGRVSEAIMSFDVMDKYGVEPDIDAVNSLMSAICQEENQIEMALAFFDRIKVKIPPDADTFTILLEGCKKKGDVKKAKTMFGEMVIRIGWKPENVPAYNTFLTTLVCGSEIEECMRFIQVMKGKGCLPGLKFFSTAFDILVKQNDCTHAPALWTILMGSGMMPNTIMFNAMIKWYCDNNDVDNAFHFLDMMVFYGAFPDSLTYNMIFECLIKAKKVHEVGRFFQEMTKNECPLTPSNCDSAIEMLFERDDPETAIEIWNYMLDNEILPIDGSANALLVGLAKLGRFSEVKRFAGDILDKKIIIFESTMAKLKTAFCKEGRNDAYVSLQRQWKAFAL